MNIVTKDIHFGNEVLTLTNQRVLFWEAQEALILSDIHIGKTAHFRQHGIAVPDAILMNDLQRLQVLIENFNPKKLIVVGDLFHAEYNQNFDVFIQWMQQFDDLEKILIRGNHDRFPTRFYESLGFLTKKQAEYNALVFVHDTVKVSAAKYYISGHIHPGVRIKMKGRQYLKLPCFQVNSQQLILPAFSLFTGLNTRSTLENIVNYAFTEDAILEL
ncbi:3',5'-cyclic adenosine monophosphate phosphodiesterase CpdA [Kordia sp. SMS9]|uniref:ligase-associated DNA damage response endonuclease PdeM n=1 Tax=Kordia sp. SMS9 TaxID=2282170 RepID=UPI000E0DC7F4|nr:ligase-associated DNA damage response endonuclease PdeM [Kordia sp. SMS9]AXG72427.1 3',5'-cyclic adenosine monophosphate phosphodiesterase CpdA [Kordia sp. SMS9]